MWEALLNMANSGDVIRYTFVQGYIRRVQARKPKEKSFTIECAFCNGRGIITDGIFPSQDCPVHGCKAGWLTFHSIPEDYKPCGTCKGTGKEGDDIWGWKPCHFCQGSGLVKVH
jgi:hypothetical protein